MGIVAGLRREFDILWDETASTIEDPNPAPLDWRPDGSSGLNPPTVIVTHLCGAHTFWVGELVGGVPSERDRAAEFADEVKERATAASLMSLLEKTRQSVDRVLVRLTDGELLLPSYTGSKASSHPLIGAGETVTRLFCLLHALTHHAHHNGQLRLLTRLWSETARGGPGGAMTT